MLCSVCLNMGAHFDELFLEEGFCHMTTKTVDGIKQLTIPEKRGVKHHVDILGLASAADSGCELCKLILQETRNPKRGFKTSLECEDQQIYACMTDYGRMNPSTSMIVFHQVKALDLMEVPRLSTILGVFLHPDDPLAKKPLIRGRPVFSDPLSVSAKAIISGWMDECLESHPSCPSNPDAFLPSRVINVGPPDGSQDPFIFISKDTIGQWIALSHCWGGQLSSTTTSVNLEQRTHSLTLESLPLNFRDAITITQTLGYRYLWIDALCILQDSQDDWVAHLPHMSYIYKNAAIMIAADIAKDTTGSILVSRERATHSLSLPYSSDSRDIRGSLQIRASLNAEPTGPLQSRGWTLQEDILSPRTLCFSEDQLLWQCQTLRSSEGDFLPPSSNGLPDHSWDVHLKRSFSSLKKPHIHDFSIHPDSSPHDKIMNQWCHIVNAYAKRNLTFEDDRLPALSGIARELQKLTKYTYKAGIWLEDIHKGLLWSSNGTGTRRDTLSGRSVPSWTWAGVTFPSPRFLNPPYNTSSGPHSHLRKIYGTITEKAVLVDILIENTDGDPYGRVTKGVLTMEGRCLAVKEWLLRHRQPILYKKGERFDVSDIYQPRTYSEIITTSPQILCEIDHIEDWLPSCSQGEYYADFESRVTLLQILKWDGYGKKPLGVAFCLILEPTGNANEYVRRGVAEVPDVYGMADEGWETRTFNIL